MPYSERVISPRRDVTPLNLSGSNAHHKYLPRDDKVGQMDKTLYNIATVFSLGGFVSTVVDGYTNVKNQTPSIQLVIMLLMALCATLLRTPLLLSNEGTLREMYLFSGYALLEGVALTLNLLAFDSVRATTFAVLVAVVSTVMLGVLSRKTWRLLHRKQQ